MSESINPPERTPRLVRVPFEELARREEYMIDIGGHHLFQARFGFFFANGNQADWFNDGENTYPMVQVKAAYAVVWDDVTGPDCPAAADVVD